MKRKIIGQMLVCPAVLLLTACGKQTAPAPAADNPAGIKDRLLAAAASLQPGAQLYFEDGLTITGVGLNDSGNATQKSDNFFWPAIQKLTGVDLDIFWGEQSEYLSSLSTMLLTGIDQLPDILNADDFGVMDLADDGVIVPLDDYLALMPDIVSAVGAERMDYWRQADGHIYTIPSVTNVPGAQTMMIRRDWLDALGLSEPQTWEDWLTLWRAIRDHDVNGNGDPSDEIPFAAQYGNDKERCFLPLLNAFGIRTSGDTQFCLLDDGTYTMIYEHPKYREFLEALHGLYQEGLIAPDFDTQYLENIDAAMDENRLGTVYNWAERCRTSAQTLRDSGTEAALWEAVAPITGPDGIQLTPERLMVSSVWCLTSAAEKAGKAEDIARFFNWCFTEEGSYLYSYGLPGISYELVDGVPVMARELTANGFTDYRAAGCNIGSFGGLWQEGAFTQCLFEGRSETEMDDLTEQFYRGISVVNTPYFYTMPKTWQTPAYTRYRAALITEGVCQLRNQAIRGEISIDQFFTRYERLKQRGLQAVIEEAAKVSPDSAALSGKED